MKQTKSTKKQSAKTQGTKVFKELHSEEFGNVRVVSDMKDGEGYVSILDLCNILQVNPKEILPKLNGHISIAEETKGNHEMVPYVDEYGLYIFYLMSKEKDAIRFQNWLHKEFLQSLYEQRKALTGLNKNDKLVIEADRKRQALRIMATAKNVVKSGHFLTGKEIPALTLAHLLGWWYNTTDKSTFMLQFNCHSNPYIYDNIRMNVYLTKDKEGCIEECDMHISFLDLDADNHEFLTIDTVMPDFVLTEWNILDFIMEDQFMKEDVLDPENADLVLILNGTMSFHRSRRIEKTEEQPLIEFV